MELRVRRGLQETDKIRIPADLNSSPNMEPVVTRENWNSGKKIQLAVIREDEYQPVGFYSVESEESEESEGSAGGKTTRNHSELVGLRVYIPL